jgi:hypothetical protein
MFVSEDGPATGQDYPFHWNACPMDWCSIVVDRLNPQGSDQRGPGPADLFIARKNR